MRKFAIKHSINAERAEIEEYSVANIKFHRTILELSGVVALGTLADALFIHMHAVRRRALGENDRAEHMEIIEALESRNGDLAANLVREHTMRLHAHIHKTWTRLENIGSARAESNLS